MIFRRFTIRTILRIALIAINLIIIASIFGDSRLFFNQFIFGTVCIVQIIELIHFVNTTNRDMTRFIDAIRQSDFTINFSKDEMGKSFFGLSESMRVMLDTYKKVKIEKEVQYHLLKQIISHVSTGIIVVTEGNDITLINESARNILKVPLLKTWKGLESKSPEFFNQVSELPGDEQILMQVTIDGDKKDLSLNISRFTLLDQAYQLITFSDIKSEIEQKEIEAWYRLIRILTHEIMNSVTPIASLSETIKLMLEEEDGKPKPVDHIDAKTIHDVLFSTETIMRRSEGLLDFVEDYRKLVKIPHPKIQTVNVKDLLSEFEYLMSSELSKRNINLQIRVEPEFEIDLDKNLITQILINLVKNSFEALECSQNKQIKIEAAIKKEKKIITISDNGPGIDKKDIEDIWVPFFTTKKEGSGIGLSLSRQIMKLHSGKLWVNSVPDKETTFTLAFRK